MVLGHSLTKIDRYWMEREGEKEKGKVILAQSGKEKERKKRTETERGAKYFTFTIHEREKNPRETVKRRRKGQ